ncbi:MAG: hypothetical protein IKI29_01605 [Clostridia bacterium]|nr:hypothetical protein [Clostridia bacterium]
MDDALFPARVEDIATQCERTNMPKFLGFLTAVQSGTAEKLLKNRGISFGFFGGYEGAERVILGCFPEWCDEWHFPVEAVTIAFRQVDSLTHRDFLGALMGLGIVRQAVGDILVEKGRAVVFLQRDIVKYVTEQLTAVGRTGVKITLGCELPLPSVGQTVAQTDTVASLRLDGVVSALCSISRNKAEALIHDGLVSVNSIGAQKATLLVKQSDVLSVRGFGRFHIDSCDKRSKKDRIILEYSKYI